MDILLPDEKYQDNSLEYLTRYASKGQMIISEMVYSELASQFSERDVFYSFLQDTGIELIRSGEDVLWLAGSVWCLYSRQRKKDKWMCGACGRENSGKCRKCGNVFSGRQHIVSDFIIGAHAQILSDGLLSRDRGVYKRYFPKLKLLYSHSE